MASSTMSNAETKVLEETLENYRLARDYAKNNYHTTWDDCWKIYNNRRTARSNYDGVADTFVPETFTIVESIMANVAGGKPRFEFYPQYPLQTADTRVLNALVDFYWEQNRLGLKAIPWVRDSIVYGTGILFATWGEHDCPEIKHIPLKDFFIDPMCTVIDVRAGIGSARFAGFRYLTTLQQLKDAKVVNPDFDDTKPEGPKNERLVPKYKNLELLEKDNARPMDEPLDKEEKDAFIGSTLGDKAREKQIECIYYVDLNRVKTIANHKVVIEDEETPFKRDAQMIESVDDAGNKVSFELPEIKPFLPFAPLRNYIDGSLFYARGDCEVLLDSQEHLNDTAAQKIDNLSYINNRMFTLDPAYADKIDEFDAIPGAIFTVPPGAFEQLTTQPLGVDADNEMFRVKDEMRRATAADEIIQGAGQDKGRITATEVRAQLAQAGSRFAIKLNVLETEGYATLASILFKLIQIFVTQETAVRIIGPKGIEFKNYNPGEYLGDYDPKVMLDTTARTLKLEDRQRFIEFFQIGSKLPFVDQQKLFTDTAEKVYEIDPEDAKAYILEAPQPGGPGPEDAPDGVTMEDLPPEIAERMEAEAAAAAAEENPVEPLGVADVASAGAGG